MIISLMMFSDVFVSQQLTMKPVPQTVQKKLLSTSSVKDTS